MKVVDITTKAFWKGEFGITGLVEDQGQSYTVKLEVKGSHVNSCSCSCTLGSSPGKLCDHAQLLLTHYQEQTPEGAGKAVSTSSQVRTMIREYTNREVARIVQEEEVRQVEFVPRLLLDRQAVKVEFKLGRERHYVVKDLIAFAQAMSQGTFLTYGKNLAFHHSIESFSDESKGLMNLVLELVNAYREHFEQFQKSSYSTVPLLRELNLNRVGRERFFQLLSGQMLEVEDYRGSKRQVLLRDENPELVISVRKSGRDGIKVSVNKKLSSFMGEKYLYIMDIGSLYRCDEICSQAFWVFFEQMTQGFGAPYEVSVNQKDVPLFYERVLRKLEPYGILDVKGVDFESLRPMELKAKFIFDSNGPDELVMRPELRYGDHTFHPVEDEHLPRTVCRDVPGEFRISQVITKYFKYRDPESNDLIIRNDDDAVYQLLSKGMEELRALGEVYLSDSWRHLSVLPSPKISVGVRGAGDWLELTIDAGDMNVSELQKILAGYHQKKPYYRLKSGEFLKLDDNGLMTVAKMVDGLAITKGDLQNQSMMIPRYRALYMDSIYKEHGGITFYRDHLFKAIVRGMNSVEDSDYELPQSLQPILRGYQKTGFRWLRTLDTCGFGGILADDMGLGKTIQVISLLLDEREIARAGKAEKSLSLIVCPASLVYNWEWELHTYAPDLEVRTIAGTGQEREERLLHAKDCDVMITSYDLLKRDIHFYQSLNFRFQVIDEAQYIKNPMTQSAKAVKLIQARTRYALTGTPIENRLSELWSIFDYLMPGFLYSYQKFKKTFEQPVVKDGDQESLHNLHQMTGPFILRRLKKDVLKELPDKLETVVYSKFEQEQKELYMANASLLKEELEQKSGSDYGRGKIQVLAELTKLRQLCCDPKLYYENYRGGSAKLETCMELVAGGVAGGHKILLFSQFTSMLDIISKRMAKEGIAFHMLTGSTPKDERLHMVNSFHKDHVPVFLISLKAGGTGLNLTAADMVIHYDPWWNVAAQNQATDRTHRIGQEKQVAVFKLITKDTIEENILKLQESKQNLVDQVISEGTVSLGTLTKEELLKLLS